MKSLLALIFLAVTPAPAATIDPNRMVRVLVEVEGGKWTDFGGAAHIQYQAWSDRSPHAYQLSKRAEYAIPVYLAHVQWIESTLRKHGITPTPAAVGMCWRWGFSGARARGFTGSYGDRAANLYHDKAFR